MFRRLREWFRSSPKTGEALAAQQEAKTLRESMETQRMGALEGPPNFTHGGKESR